MAVEEVACPHCGEVTMSTVPQDGKIVATEPDPDYSTAVKGNTTAACSECENKFTSIYVNQ